MTKAPYKPLTAAEIQAMYPKSTFGNSTVIPITTPNTTSAAKLPKAYKPLKPYVEPPIVDTRPKPSDPHLAELLDILSYARPHGSEMGEVFCKKYLDVIPGMRTDAVGNRILKITKDPRILWSCHFDTVHNRGGRQNLTWVGGTIKLAKDSAKPGNSLGADDGAGLWLMLQMLRQNIPGLYIFHTGEEVGGIGSTHISRHTPELLKGIDMAIAFDRQDWDDVITHQGGGKCASDAFAKSLAALLPGKYMPSDRGVFTDTANYTDLVAECTNLSVGYQRQHGPRETLDAIHLLKMRDALLVADFSTLVVEREPGDDGYAGFSYYGGGYTFGRSRGSLLDRSYSNAWGGSGGDDSLDWDPDNKRGSKVSASRDIELLEYAGLVGNHPYLAAKLLLESGIDLDEFAYEALQDERR